MSRICPLYSGSTGNSTYICSPAGSILVDAGASARALNKALSDAGGSAEKLSAILITHEHTDHIKGLKVLLKNLKIPVIASRKTLDALIGMEIFPVGAELSEIAEKPLCINGIEIRRFATSHDCEGSSGYRFNLPDCSVSVCTDTGVITDEIHNALIGSDAVILESNHDVDMLKSGPYPPELKFRIMSDKGHISNNVCAAELKHLVLNGTRRVILGHLSLKNNTPMLAKSCAEAALMDMGAVNGEDYTLSVAAPTSNRVTVI